MPPNGPYPMNVLWKSNPLEITLSSTDRATEEENVTKKYEFPQLANLKINFVL